MMKLRCLVVMVFLLCCAVLLAQVHQWRDIYKVKKKDTLYGIAQSYGLTVDDLIAANPEMGADGFTLKKGDVVFIPYVTTPTTTTVTTTNSKSASHRALKVGVMLPLHNIDGDGRRMVEYYRGVLIACDSLRAAGVTTDVYAWNVSQEANISSVLLDSHVKEMDIIFGPLYTKQVKTLADFCKDNDIKLVIPFSISATDVQTNDHVYQVYQPNETLNRKAISAFVGRFADAHVIVIDCNDSTSQKGAYTSALRQEIYARNISCSVTSLASSDEAFRAAFDRTKTNVLVLNTARSPELNLVFRRLNELTAIEPTVAIAMYGYTEWLMYETTYRELFHKYDTYIPSTFYYYRGLTRVAAFEQAYYRWFNEGMQERYIPRMALTGFDQAYFFLRGLYDRGSAFHGVAGESTYKPLQTPLRFDHMTGYQGYQNTAFQLVHYKKAGIIETLQY